MKLGKSLKGLWVGNYKLHVIQGYIQSMFLIEYENTLLLLDSGCRCDVEVVEDFITKTLNRPMSDLKLVVVTHAHPDHSGGACLYQKKFNIKIAAVADVNNWYAGLNGLITYFVDIFLTYLVAKKKKVGFKNVIFSRRIKKIDTNLRDNEVLEGFADWIVLKTSGHTDSDISLYHEKSSTLYIADNLIKGKTNYYRPYPIFRPEEYKKTLELYLKLKPQRFLLAHFGVEEISPERILYLKESVSQTPRSHRTTLASILLKRFILKSKKPQ